MKRNFDNFARIDMALPLQLKNLESFIYFKVYRKNSDDTFNNDIIINSSNFFSFNWVYFRK